jgi:Double zinc ribbon
MSLNSCPFCEQPNPPDAKFCNACGGALHLVPCPNCGAVSDVTATTCYQCRALLPGRKSDVPAAELPAAEASAPAPRPLPRATIGAAALAAVVVLGASYYGYRQHARVDLPVSTAASGEASAHRGAADVGSDAAIGDAAASSSTQVGPGNDGQAAGPAMSPSSETPLAGRAPAGKEQPRADREPKERRRVNAASGLIARPKAAEAAKAGRRKAPHQEVCDEAVAALGLCKMTPEERQLVKATAALKAAIASSRAAEPDEPAKAEQQSPPRPGECTEAVVALGLCTPSSTQRRK